MSTSSVVGEGMEEEKTSLEPKVSELGTLKVAQLITSDPIALLRWEMVSCWLVTNHALRLDLANYSLEKKVVRTLEIWESENGKEATATSFARIIRTNFNLVNLAEKVEGNILFWVQSRRSSGSAPQGSHNCEGLPVVLLQDPNLLDQQPVEASVEFAATEWKVNFNEKEENVSLVPSEGIDHDEIGSGCFDLKNLEVSHADPDQHNQGLSKQTIDPELPRLNNVTLKTTTPVEGTRVKKYYRNPAGFSTFVTLSWAFAIVLLTSSSLLVHDWRIVYAQCVDRHGSSSKICVLADAHKVGGVLGILAGLMQIFWVLWAVQYRVWACCLTITIFPYIVFTFVVALLRGALNIGDHYHTFPVHRHWYYFFLVSMILDMAFIVTSMIVVCRLPPKRPQIEKYKRTINTPV